MYIKKFNQIHISDVPSVGGKNASLGEMFNELSSKGIVIPDGFATTASAFRYFLDYNAITARLKTLLDTLDTTTFKNLKEIGAEARSIIEEARIPQDLSGEIIKSYKELCNNNYFEVAV